jgi:hypothetical protein
MGLLDRWIGRRRPAGDADGGSPAPWTGAAKPVRAWRSLPPMPLALAPPAVTVQTAAFEAALVSRRSPAFLGPLGHQLTAEAPAGVAGGLATRAEDPPGPDLAGGRTVVAVASEGVWTAGPAPTWEPSAPTAAGPAEGADRPLVTAPVQRALRWALPAVAVDPGGTAPVGVAASPSTPGHGLPPAEVSPGRPISLGDPAGAASPTGRGDPAPPQDAAPATTTPDPAAPATGPTGGAGLLGDRPVQRSVGDRPAPPGPPAHTTGSAADPGPPRVGDRPARRVGLGPPVPGGAVQRAPGPTTGRPAASVPPDLTVGGPSRQPADAATTRPSTGAAASPPSIATPEAVASLADGVAGSPAPAQEAPESIAGGEATVAIGADPHGTDGPPPLAPVLGERTVVLASRPAPDQFPPAVGAVVQRQFAVEPPAPAGHGAAAPDPAALAVASGLATPDDAGGVVFGPPAGAGQAATVQLAQLSQLTEGPTAQLSQLTDGATGRVERLAEGAADLVQQPAAGGQDAMRAAAGALGKPGAAAPADLDELARRLYDRFRSRLMAELRLDRERAGLVTDMRH